MLKSCLYAICSQCSHNKIISDVGADDIDAKFINKINKYISENISVYFTQKEIAEALHYEYHYFSQLFHKNFKVGFVRYINSYRFKIACRMLTTTDEKISHIATECGFASIRSFNRVFKDLSGKSPEEYRNSTTVMTIKKSKANL